LREGGETVPFNIMQWNGSFDGPWSEDAERKYREGGFDGLSITGGPDWNPASLDFVLSLDRIRSFNVRAQVRQDLAAFMVASLEELVLATGSRRKIPDTPRAELRRLVVTDRPGLEVAVHWPVLESLRIGSWRGGDLRFLVGAGELKSFYSEGRRQSGTLEGIEDCLRLQEFVSVNYSIGRTRPLRELEMLSEIRLMAAPPTRPHSIIDVADLAGPELEKLWISNASGFRNADALMGAEKLREVRLIKCNLTTSDMLVLGALPNRVRVDVAA
jgi:hypothetical protein